MAKSKPIIETCNRHRYIVDLIDLKTFFENNLNCKYVLNCIDCHSKYAWSYCLADKTSENVWKCIKALFLKEGPSKVLHTDNGLEFVNHLIENLCDEFKVLHIRGKPYTPRVHVKLNVIIRQLKKC